MDEPGLRQTLAIYQAPKEPADSTGTLRDALSGGDIAKPLVTEKSPLPNVHLAIDPPAAPAVDAEKTAAAIKPAAGAPLTASP
jgi:hypothetical protein